MYFCNPKDLAEIFGFFDPKDKFVYYFIDKVQNIRDEFQMAEPGSSVTSDPLLPDVPPFHKFKSEDQQTLQKIIMDEVQPTRSCTSTAAQIHTPCPSAHLMHDSEQIIGLLCYAGSLKIPSVIL